MGKFFQKCPGARVGGLAQSMLADKGLRRRGRQTGGAGHHIRGSLINLVIGEVAGIHAMIGDQDAFQTIEDKEIGLSSRHCKSCASRSGQGKARTASSLSPLT
jgi:hypothetical protein